MTTTLTVADQKRFAAATAKKLAAIRKSKRLTQAQVAARTNGAVSKASLANYETGHRSLRIDVVWIIICALGEDIGAIMQQVQREVLGYTPQTTSLAGVTLSVPAIVQDANPRLDSLRLWLRAHQSGNPSSTIQLDGEALRHLATIMRMSVDDALTLLRTSRLVVS